MSIFFVYVRQDLFYAYDWPSRLVRPIWKNAKIFRGPPSRPCLCIRLAITACPTHLEGQTSPEHTIFWVIRNPMSKMPIYFVDVRQDLVYAYGWPSRLVRPIWKVKRAPKRAYPSFRRFSCAIAHDFLGDSDSDVKNSKFFRGRPSRPCQCIRLAIMACPTHLEAHDFLGNLDFDVENANFFVDVRQDLFYAYGWPSWLVRPIWKVKRASKRAYPSFQRFSCAIAHLFLVDPDSNVKNAKFFRGRPSRPCLCIRLAITACPTHLEGQTSPEASIPLISMIFVCNNSTRFFG
uniref:Uncharacterized protein n=1 Tax=Solanum lycopersicum TaxID=4081 RepID=A0A3Q7J1B0_SOLLC